MTFVTSTVLSDFGIQSSMEDVLNEHLGDRTNIHVAVGVDVGKAIVTRLGVHGQRITMCFGRESTEAERLQRISVAKQIRISAEVYDELDDDDLRDEFTKSGKAYVATGLTFGKLDDKQEESAAKADLLRAEARDGRVLVTTKASEATERGVATKPWSKAGVSKNPANTDKELKSE
ncbi:adenylate/guanylate cyclase domain-containing protein [Allorhodopirellula heiligendammensis]|uniref:Adenylate and Guanylate cyclase catalytic domain protein n=1 Tax=Allorhodopirellula heiligendammensis TaxID=2714739 RepID=A0A5C6C0L4_9BACT|nr:adenylate/guanylate cyclase domain-containing protein [Allorhodopirellula heiligendammensis]TWU16694.1 Adenylate and Guanylate cyclase catalytic domain protein [Allorhodopirellula heiligendammensis]